MEELKSIPESIEPECWSDDSRLNVLFAPFRQRSVNSKDWDDKLTFWKNFIAKFCNHTGTYAFKTSSLLKIFAKDGRSPACLSDVVENMARNGELESMQQFMEKKPETWVKWTADLMVKKPISWSLKKISGFLMGDKDVERNYVHLETVKAHAQRLFIRGSEQFGNKVLSYRQLLALGKECGVNVNDIQLLLHYLQEEGKVCLRELSDSQSLLVKFGDVKKFGRISDFEMDVYTLEQSAETLLKNVEKLECEIVAVTEETKEHLRKGHKQTVSSMP